MLYLSGIFLSFFLSFMLLTKKGKSPADFILMAWLALTGFHLLTFYLRFSNQSLQYPTITALGFSLPLVQGPFLFLYTTLQTSDRSLKWTEGLHFLPLLASYLLFGSFYLLPFDQKVEIFRVEGHGYETQAMINLYAVYLSGVVYTIISLIRLLRYRRGLVDEFSSTDKINFNWLLYLIIWIALIWAVILIIQEDALIFGAAALFVLWLGYFGIRQVRVFTHPVPALIATADTIPSESTTTLSPIEPVVVQTPSEETTKYQKSGLSDADADLIHQSLRQLLDERKPYTDPDLTLTDLARLLNVHHNVLSQVINSRERKTFYDLINERRTEEFIRRLSEPLRQQYTLMAIAYDCGFNSKASFNRNFKKYTGLTPTEYLAQLPS